MAYKPMKRSKRGKLRFGGIAHFDLSRFCSDLGRALQVPFESPGIPAERQVSWRSEDEFLITYLFAEMLSKFDDGKPSPAKDELTWQRFVQAEASCFEINNSLSVSGFPNRHLHVIHRARELIAKMLGDFSWDDCEPFMGWGPGASTRLRRRQSDAAYKYSGKPETTSGNSILGYTAI